MLGIIELEASGLSAAGPDQIFTPASGRSGTACLRPFAAMMAVRILFAARFDFSSLLLSSISAAVLGANPSSLTFPGEDIRLSGGVAVSSVRYSFASSLYWRVSR